MNGSPDMPITDRQTDRASLLCSSSLFFYHVHQLVINFFAGWCWTISLTGNALRLLISSIELGGGSDREPVIILYGFVTRDPLHIEK